MIHELLRGAPGPGGTVQLVCGNCVAAAQDAFTENSRVLNVCSNCGMPLGESQRPSKPTSPPFLW